MGPDMVIEHQYTYYCMEMLEEVTVAEVARPVEAGVEAVVGVGEEIEQSAKVVSLFLLNLCLLELRSKLEIYWLRIFPKN